MKALSNQETLHTVGRSGSVSVENTNIVMMAENMRNRKYTARKVKQGKERKDKVNHDEVGINGITQDMTKTIYQTFIFLWTALKHFTQYFAIQVRKLGQSTDSGRVKKRKTRNSEKGKTTKKGGNNPRNQVKEIATSLPRKNKHSAVEKSPRTNQETRNHSPSVPWHSPRRNRVSPLENHRSPPKNQHSPQRNEWRTNEEQVWNTQRTAWNRPRTNHRAWNTSTRIPQHSLPENTHRTHREPLRNNQGTQREHTWNRENTERRCGTDSLGRQDSQGPFTTSSHNSNPRTVEKSTRGQHIIVKLTVLIVTH